MSDDRSQPTPNLNLEREHAAHRELGETTVPRGLARAAVALFVLTLVSVPALELALGWGEDAGIAAAYADLARGPLDACAIQRTETLVEERSEVARHVRPFVQSALLRGLRLGSEEAYLAPGGRLYQRAGFEHVTGAPFLDPEVLARRMRDADPCAPLRAADPLPAIVRFHEDLARRGIALVLVPTPIKPTIDGEALGGEPGATVRNASFEAFVSALERAGVVLFDPAPHLTRWRSEDGGRSAYLATDTHWRPEAMERVAVELARFVDAGFDLGARGPMTTRRSLTVANRGDLVTSLGIDPAASPFPLERVAIHEVRDENGRPWRPSRGAPVLLLGDSFSNLYAIRRAFAQVEDGESLDWGESAGLAEQLSHHLGRPVDRIARNAGGAHATRRDLVRELGMGRTRLDGVRVVVWQFAVRELSQGDWQVLPLPER